MIRKPRMMGVDGCSQKAMHEAVQWFVNEASMRMLAMHVAVHMANTRMMGSTQCDLKCNGCAHMAMYEAVYWL